MSKKKLNANEYQCLECKKIFSKKGIGPHIWRAHKEGKTFKPFLGKTLGRKGKTFTEIFGEEKANKTKNKIAQSRKGKPWKASSKEIELQRCNKISKKMQKVGGGYRKGSGRGKSGWYKGYWCDSSWELAYVIYNLDHGIKFVRNKEGFNYIFRGRKYNYYPDFIKDNIFIEIKGYWTEQFEEKVKQFSRKLKIIDKVKIQKYLQYVIKNYGKDFTQLYE